ncbi:MAG TPA: bifunctional hydroxymethylpyrimidine kinase/phosphomethylpyrimidine kinase [Bryobacteraceae bacterium]
MITPVALSIAGSDPSGGAGIQADLKTFHSLGVYGEAVITLITVQNTRGVHRVDVLAPELVAEQIHAVISDIPPKAAKTGALGNLAVVKAVAAAAETFSFPLVVDPVMISKNGAWLMDAEARRTFTEELLPRAFLLTPNLPEAAALSGIPVHDADSMARAAAKLLEMGAANVLVKGGHLEGEALDLLASPHVKLRLFRAPRVDTPHTHGTGCTFSAAITAELAKGASLEDAIHRAKRFITEAIRTNPGLGSGSGPVNHFSS